jgi:RNA polymerase sigma-70 factor, ECF subfamily
MEIAGLYTQFHNPVLGYIRSKIRPKEDAEDVLQNIFIKVSSNVDKLNSEEKLQSWIFTITRNAIIDYYRVNASRKNMSMNEPEGDILEAETFDSTKGLEQCMDRMINLLPDEYREIIIDSELKGVKQKELAEKYGVAYPTMRSRVQRGRERLKQLFHNCCHIATDRLGNILEAKERSDCNHPCKPGQHQV